MSFDDFVRGYLQSKQPEFARVGSQARFVGYANGKPHVTHLFRHDAQDRLIAFLQDRLNTDINLEVRNVSPKIPLTLSPGVETRLRKKYAMDFDLWAHLT
jgi:hypothetical protein